MDNPIETPALEGAGEEAIRRALAELDQEYAVRSGEAAAQRRVAKSPFQKMHDVWRSAGVGIAQVIHPH